MPETDFPPLTGALRRILGPLTQLLIARGVRFQDASDRLKETFVASAMGLARDRATDSRLSVLTGLQRKDVKAIRSRLGAGDAAPLPAGPIPRVIQNWRTRPDFQGSDGGPATLPRKSDDVPSFETLAATVSTDIHPRSILDEMLRLELVKETPDGLRLLAEAFVPGQDNVALYTYLGGNLGDHAQAAVTNVLAEGRPPFFERAVHYNGLTEDDLAELDRLARSLQQRALEQIAARAAKLQDRSDGKPGASGRFRCGAFILTEIETDPEGQS